MRFEVPAGAVSAVLSILPFVIGYITTAMHTLRAAQHSARVARVSEQLKALYGPLLACVTASKSSHDAMLKQASLEQKAGGALGTAEFMSPAEFRAAAAADAKKEAAAKRRIPRPKPTAGSGWFKAAAEGMNPSRRVQAGEEGSVYVRSWRHILMTALSLRLCRYLSVCVCLSRHVCPCASRA